MSHRPEDAANWAARGLELSRRLGARVGEAMALESLGRVAIAESNLAEAEIKFRQAIATYHRAGDVGGVATCTNNLAMLLHLHRHWDGAEQLYKEALRLWEDSGNAPMLCIAINNLAELYEDRGQRRPADAMYRRGLEAARQMLSPQQEAKALLGLARCSASEGRIDDARRLAHEGRDIAYRANLTPFLRQAEALISRL